MIELLTQGAPENIIIEKFNELYNTTNQKIDLLVGGPPCQGFSIAGKRDIKDPRNSLFMEYVKYLEFFKPKAFIMENVIGILSMKALNKENVIDIIMSSLSINYNCIVCKLYASDFEVPQNRRRTIIIGVRKDLNIIPTEPKIILTKNNRTKSKMRLSSSALQRRVVLNLKLLWTTILILNLNKNITD